VRRLLDEGREVVVADDFSRASVLKLILFDGGVRFKGALNFVALLWNHQDLSGSILINVDGERNGR